MSNAVSRFSGNLLRRFFAISLPADLTKHIQFHRYSTDAGNAVKAEHVDTKGLTLTDSCVKHMKEFANKDEFLRIYVEGGGCSGFSYKFQLDKEKGDDDLVFSRDGVEIVTDADSFQLIKGSSVDYEIELIKSSFRIVGNPQSTVSCSCGVSFSIE